MLVNCRKWKMVHKAFRLLDRLFDRKPKKEREAQLKTVPMNISDYDNTHTIQHWHGNCYMDKDGYVYEVKKKEFNNVK